jgi:hypothetical protein
MFCMIRFPDSLFTISLEFILLANLFCAIILGANQSGL